MTTPFYVAPEQLMKDRADYARKGIARGRALVAIRYVEGIVVVAENASETLRKVSEIYDRRRKGNLVLSQQPEAGTGVAIGTPVNLVVNQGD